MPQHHLMVEPVLALKDNYVWLFKTSAHTWAAVDPGEAGPVIHHLDSLGETLSHILLTHHHHDHTGGVEALRRHGVARGYTPLVIGAEKDAHRLPPLDVAVTGEQRLSLGDLEAEVMEVPGHTLGHVVYRVLDTLFAGDTLFRFGCGRVFEGTPEKMWDSLSKIRALPDTTQLCAGHEYTLVNLQFACSLEPNNAALQTLLTHIFRQTDMEQPTMPSPLGEEKQYNPFLRSDDPAFAKNIGLTGLAAEQVFASIRKKRNSF
ncbi:MAG: hydroxyacylglutathione hydrolase [Magnetococcales bacterium]|nr:hydroxyacylglutathione hydrolase [Magnetococcales bacterium]